MNFYFNAKSEGNKEKAYDEDVLEGNWFEDRCTSDYDNKKRKDYMLPNPNKWQYDTTYNELGQNWKEFPPTQKHFQIANDNFLNFNNMDYNMFVSTNKHAMDPRYRETFRTPIDMKDYYKNKEKDLDEYRKNWTKKDLIQVKKLKNLKKKTIFIILLLLMKNFPNLIKILIILLKLMVIKYLIIIIHLL